MASSESSPVEPGKKAYQTFHSPCETLRRLIHVVVVQPEFAGNIGSIARALANMGIEGSFRIVGTSQVISEETMRLAVHATDLIEKIEFFETFEAAIAIGSKEERLIIGTSSHVGSSNRPHPLLAEVAMERALEKLKTGDIGNLVLVFGREGDGLNNEEMAACDWIATIPAVSAYRSLNLAQAVLIFCYELNRRLVQQGEFRSDRVSQKQRMITHFLQLAETVGFILPGDPYRMKSRLEDILAQLPHHIKDASTLHGLLDQAVRSIRKGEPDIRGRYKKTLKSEE